MIITEENLRQVIRENLQKEQIDEGLMGILANIVGALFGMFGDGASQYAEEVDTGLTSASEAAAGEIQGVLEIDEKKSWEELKPKENNTDKAIWALTIEKVMSGAGQEYGAAFEELAKATALSSVAPPSEEEAAAWEDGPDAQSLELIYKGIGAVKGTLLWLGVHFTGAEAAANSIDEEDPSLSKVLTQVAGAAEFIATDVVNGLESATSAVEATGDTGFGSGIANIQQYGDMIKDAAQSGADHVSTLEDAANEAAEKAETASAGDPGSGMPEGRILKVTRSEIYNFLVEAMGNAYEWKVASKENMLLHKDGMEKQDKENQEKYLKSMGLMEIVLGKILLKAI